MIPMKLLAPLIERQVNDWTDQYVNTQNPDDIWFGGLDLDSKHDYARSYMSPDVLANWGTLGEADRRSALHDSVRSAMGDDDDAFGEKLMKKGVPLALAALGGYGAFTALGGAGALGAGGGSGGTVAGVADAAGNIIPGTEAVAGGGSGVLGKLGKAAGSFFKNPDGTKNWSNIIKAGGIGAGVLGGLAYDAPPQAGPPPPAQDNTPLRQLNYSRPRAAGPDDYFTYGQSGGEHRFFQDAEFTEAAPSNPPGGAPAQDDLVPPRGFKLLAHGGSSSHVRGPGSGREDKIEALLSADEYVIDAETVAMLGDGSPEEGARRLDEMRRNIRTHKGKALAKGKFSPNAKAPESYIGKARGGSIRRVISGGLPKPARDDEQARLDAIRRFEAAYREAARRKQQPVKKAAGGKVAKRGAMGNLVRLSNQFQRALESGNTERVAQLSKLLDSHGSGVSKEGMVAFARGGSVTGAIRRFLNSMQTQPEPPPPIRQSQVDLDQIALELERMNPNSEVLRSYRASQRRPPIDMRRRRTDRRE